MARCRSFLATRGSWEVSVDDELLRRDLGGRIHVVSMA